MGNVSLNEGILLLQNSRVADFNLWRFKNLTLKLDLSDMDFSDKNLSGCLSERGLMHTFKFFR